MFCSPCSLRSYKSFEGGRGCYHKGRELGGAGVFPSLLHVAKERAEVWAESSERLQGIDQKVDCESQFLL